MFSKKHILIVSLLFLSTSCFAELNLEISENTKILSDVTKTKMSGDTTLYYVRIQPYFSVDSKKINLEACETDGGTPELAEAFIYTKLKRPKIIILCKWDDIHMMEGINANRYQVFVYEYPNKILIERKDIERKFGENGEGEDGLFFNKPSIFKYKDKAAIIKKLDALKSLH